MEHRAAFWTHDDKAAEDGFGHLYYFAPANRAAPPYLTQRHVSAIIDVAADGTLAGVELIENMPPPPAAPVSPIQAEVKALEWSPESKPNGYCSYNHTYADTPFGRYQIEWKGWKDRPSFSLDLGNESVSCWADTIDDARRIAQADYAARIRSALQGPKDER